MAGDKRRIAYFGSKEERELLEQEIYTGEITSDEELYARAEELEISLKITDDATKVKSLENVAVGEVSSRGTMETKRKRIYGTTNAYQIVELSGSKVTNITKGSSSIIVFGNKIAKSLANDLIQKRWKPSFSLKYMGDIFGGIIKRVRCKLRIRILKGQGAQLIQIVRRNLIGLACSEGLRAECLAVVLRNAINIKLVGNGESADLRGQLRLRR